jgi:hypothetical protein
MPRTRGTPPVHLLLEKLDEALEAGVERPELHNCLLTARGARGTDQAPVWRSVTNRLQIAIDKKNRS